MIARLAVVIFISVVAAMTLSVGAQPAITGASLTDEHVQKAIAAFAEELHARKHPDRFWEPERVPAGDSTRQKGGYTALVMLAMLHGGQTYQDPRLRDAVDYLSSFGMEGTYAITLRTSVWAKLPPKFREQLQKDTQWMLDGFSETCGGWDYVQDSNSKRKDNSIRQFGALALWEAAKRGQRIEKRIWQRIEDAFLEMQLDDGGWNYTGDGPATGSMTAAGLATLFITQEQLHAEEAVKIGGPAPSPQRGKAAGNRPQLAIERGLKWMDTNFSATENPGKDTYFYYYLYGVERVGLASGYKHFGGKDWFRQGAAELIARLCAWDQEQENFAVHQTTGGDGRRAKIKTDDLAFAMMFLSRGRVPVAVNKLQFTNDSSNWNNRPRDAANLARWLGESTEGELNWQIVRMDGSPEEWLDAPFLYVASHEALPFLKDLAIDPVKFALDVKEFIKQRAAGTLPADTAPPARPEIPELDKLKRYLDLGGMMLAVNEGNGKKFAESIEAAGLLMYPQYEWRTLPEDHWAYSLHNAVKTRQPPLRALSNGVRELIILSPSVDFSETFHTNAVKQLHEFQTVGNVYFHASELNRPRPRLARHSFEASPNAPIKGEATIVRAIHAGNWRPEPAALGLFADWLRETRGIEATIVDRPLESIDQLDPKPSLVIVSGIDLIEFTRNQIDSIKAFVNAGGIILFEAPGGRGGFTASAEETMTKALGRPIESLVRTRLVTGEGMKGAADLSRIEYRPFSLQIFGGRETTPRLRGMTLADGGPPQILFSREDITHGLLDQPCWSISGYAPSSARNLLANIVQHATSLK